MLFLISKLLCKIYLQVHRHAVCKLLFIYRLPFITTSLPSHVRLRVQRFSIAKSLKLDQYPRNTPSSRRKHIFHPHSPWTSVRGSSWRTQVRVTHFPINFPPSQVQSNSSNQFQNCNLKSSNTEEANSFFFVTTLLKKSINNQASPLFCFVF